MDYGLDLFFLLKARNFFESGTRYQIFWLRASLNLPLVCIEWRFPLKRYCDSTESLNFDALLRLSSLKILFWFLEDREMLIFRSYWVRMPLKENTVRAPTLSVGPIVLEQRKSRHPFLNYKLVPTPKIISLNNSEYIEIIVSCWWSASIRFSRRTETENSKLIWKISYCKESSRFWRQPIGHYYSRIFF